MLVHKPNAGKTLHLIMYTVFPNENKGLPNENNCTNLPESLMGIQRAPWKPRVCSSHMWDWNHHPKHRRRRCHGITPGAGKKVHPLEWSKQHQQICWWLKTLQQVEGWLVDYFHDLEYRDLHIFLAFIRFVFLLFNLPLFGYVVSFRSIPICVPGGPREAHLCVVGCKTWNNLNLISKRVLQWNCDISKLQYIHCISIHNCKYCNLNFPRPKAKMSLDNWWLEDTKFFWGSTFFQGLCEFSGQYSTSFCWNIL